MTRHGVPERHPKLPGPCLAARGGPSLTTFSQEIDFLPSPHSIPGHEDRKRSTGAKYQEGKGRYTETPVLPLEKGKHTITFLVRKHKCF